MKGNPLISFSSAISMTLSCRSRGPSAEHVLPCSFKLRPTQAYSFQITAQRDPAGPTGQLSPSNYFSSSAKIYLTALQVPCFFTAPISPNFLTLIMLIISFPDWKQNTCFLLATTSNVQPAVSHAFNPALTLGKNCLWAPRETPPKHVDTRQRHRARRKSTTIGTQVPALSMPFCDLVTCFQKWSELKMTSLPYLRHLFGVLLVIGHTRGHTAAVSRCSF